MNKNESEKQLIETQIVESATPMKKEALAKEAEAWAKSKDGSQPPPGAGGWVPAPEAVIPPGTVVKVDDKTTVAGEIPKMVEESPQPIVTEKPNEEVYLFARTTQEMVKAQVRMVEWAQSRLDKLHQELKTAENDVALAKKRKWNGDPFKRIVAKTKKKITFYEKVKAALAEGYVLIPNMSADIIAVRTERIVPQRNAVTSSNSNLTVRDQVSSGSPVGLGKYVSPEAKHAQNYHTVKGNSGEIQDRWEIWAEEFIEELDFPIAFAKPGVMTATSEAMAKKIFDEIGVLPGRPHKVTRYNPVQEPKADPMVIGRITMRDGYHAKSLSFLITWFINTEDL